MSVSPRRSREKACHCRYSLAGYKISAALNSPPGSYLRARTVRPTPRKPKGRNLRPFLLVEGLADESYPELRRQCAGAHSSPPEALRRERLSEDSHLEARKAWITSGT